MDIPPPPPPPREVPGPDPVGLVEEVKAKVEPPPQREPPRIVIIEIPEEQAIEQAEEELDPSPEGPMLAYPVFYSEPIGTPEVLYNRTFLFHFLVLFIKMYRLIFFYFFFQRGKRRRKTIQSSSSSGEEPLLVSIQPPPPREVPEPDPVGLVEEVKAKVEPPPPREPPRIVIIEIPEERPMKRAAEELDPNPEGPMLAYPVSYSEPSGNQRR